MAESKIQIKIGSLEFSGEGDSKWLGEQLDKILERAIELSKKLPSPAKDDDGGGNRGKKMPTGQTLASFLKEHGDGSNQRKRFLVTAAWLALGGKTKMSTQDVTKALRDAHQPKLNNASQNLNDSVKQGFCEKDGGQFYITPDGFTDLGIEQD